MQIYLVSKTRAHRTKTGKIIMIHDHTTCGIFESESAAMDAVLEREKSFKRIEKDENGDTSITIKCTKEELVSYTIEGEPLNKIYGVF